mmetsp:Transcript_10198/g.28966  ORF Transcript_10198/g.28966 Transcript_10198/m.28966 type:complete len:202 (+) Transcript_10198:591-1196(+)
MLDQDVVGLQVRVDYAMLRQRLDRLQDLLEEPLHDTGIALHCLEKRQMVHPIDALARLEGAAGNEFAFDVVQGFRQHRAAVLHDKEDVALRLRGIDQPCYVPNAGRTRRGYPWCPAWCEEHLPDADFLASGPDIGALLLARTLRDLLDRNIAAIRNSACEPDRPTSALPEQVLLRVLGQKTSPVFALNLCVGSEALQRRRG